MRIASRLTLLLLLVVSLVMAGFGYIRAQQERGRLIAEFQQETLVLANAIKLTVEHALRDRKLQDIQELLTEMRREPSPVERIRIFDQRLVEISSPDAASGATAAAVPQRELERALTTGQAITHYLDLPDRPASYAILPLKGRRGSTIGVLEVVHEATRIRRQIEEATRDQILRLTMLAFTIALVIWLTVRISIRRPISHLMRSVLAFGQGNLEHRLELHRRDEIGQLASAFNHMAESLQAAQARNLAESQARLELEQQVQQAQKLAAVGRLASEVAHEIGTPLGVISGRAETILKRLEADHPLGRHVTTILQQIERISGILRQLLNYARPRHPSIRPTDGGPVLARVVDLLRPVAHRRQVSLQAEAPDSLPLLRADPDQLQQVLLNLVNNALDATPPGGRIRLAIGLDDPGPTDLDGRASIIRGKADEPHLTLTVTDTGCGMTDDQLRQVFEPFFSTKERQGGSGLGLAIVEDIVRTHRGSIEVRSAPATGTTILVRWPIEVGTQGTDPQRGESVEAARTP